MIGPYSKDTEIKCAPRNPMYRSNYKNIQIDIDNMVINIIIKIIDQKQKCAQL